MATRFAPGPWARHVGAGWQLLTTFHTDYSSSSPPCQVLFAFLHYLPCLVSSPLNYGKWVRVTRGITRYVRNMQSWEFMGQRSRWYRCNWKATKKEWTPKNMCGKTIWMSNQRKTTMLKPINCWFAFSWRGQNVWSLLGPMTDLQSPRGYSSEECVGHGVAFRPAR